MSARIRKWDRSKFASQLALMQYEAGRLGLYLTMHKIHEAVKQVGHEMAGTPELYDKIEEARKNDLSRRRL